MASLKKNSLYTVALVSSKNKKHVLFLSFFVIKTFGLLIFFKFVY
jgi:hypothetical protein